MERDYEIRFRYLDKISERILKKNLSVDIESGIKLISITAVKKQLPSYSELTQQEFEKSCRVLDLERELSSLRRILYKFKEGDICRFIKGEFKPFKPHTPAQIEELKNSSAMYEILLQKYIDHVRFNHQVHFNEKEMLILKRLGV